MKKLFSYEGALHTPSQDSSSSLEELGRQTEPDGNWFLNQDDLEIVDEINRKNRLLWEPRLLDHQPSFQSLRQDANILHSKSSTPCKVPHNDFEHRRPIYPSTESHSLPTYSKYEGLRSETLTSLRDRLQAELHLKNPGSAVQPLRSSIRRQIYNFNSNNSITLNFYVQRPFLSEVTHSLSLCCLPLRFLTGNLSSRSLNFKFTTCSALGLLYLHATSKFLWNNSNRHFYYFISKLSLISGFSSQFPFCNLFSLVLYSLPNDNTTFQPSIGVPSHHSVWTTPFMVNFLYISLYCTKYVPFYPQYAPAFSNVHLPSWRWLFPSLFSELCPLFYMFMYAWSNQDRDSLGIRIHIQKPFFATPWEYIDMKGGGGRAQQLPQLQLQLSRLDLYVKDVLGDGNCLYRALADQLEGSEVNFFSYKNLIVETLVENKENFKKFLPANEDIDDYIQNIDKEGA